MQDKQFKQWLTDRGVGSSTRIYAVRTIEKNLAALGSSHADLDDVWAADRFAGLRDELKAMQQDFRNGGTAYRLLMPQSEKPANRLASWRSWLGQYGQFLEGDAGGDKDADRIRRHVLESCIEPAREQDEDHAEVSVRAVNDALGLKEGWPNICQALTGRKFLEMADVAAPERIGANMSSATRFRFDLTGRVQGAPIWLVSAAGDGTDGLPGFVGRSQWRLPSGTDGRYRDMVEAMQPGDRIVLRDYLANQSVAPFDTRGRRVSAMRIRATGVIVDKDVDGLGVRVNWSLLPEARLWWLYTSNSLIWRLPVEKSEYARKLAAFLFEEAAQDFEWFLNEGLWGDRFGAQQEDVPMPDPVNLILHGPPGTGKTFATAREAVRLCGEHVPEDRPMLMAAYHKLQQEGRIGFVTFHQNFGYEDFVEGLRPVTGAQDDAGGFTLRAEPGVFRRIADLAGKPVATQTDAFSLDGRRIFKLSLGEAAKAQWNWVYDQSIEEGHVLLGFGDIDWSDPVYAERDAILREAQQRFPGERITLQSGEVKSPDRFRNQMRIGDVVIIAKGLTAFRAIGVVEGDYEYAPRPDGQYCHLRKVRWLWEDSAGVPVSEISTRAFSMDTVYELQRDRLNIAAIRRLIDSADGQADATGALVPHVLIIDEINRANISKVFGELITLLEPDKRLSMPNALTVRLPYSRDPFGVPANLHIIGTMNTADRSIALLDMALRRRFQFREIPPEPALLQEAAAASGRPLVALLATINDRIEYLIDRDHRIGHAFLMGCETGEAVDAAMRDKVIPLLQEYFFEDWSRIHAVLGDGFIGRRAIAPPPGMEGMEPRDSWYVRAPFTSDAYDRLLGRASVAEAVIEPIGAIETEAAQIGAA